MSVPVTNTVKMTKTGRGVTYDNKNDRGEPMAVQENIILGAYNEMLRISMSVQGDKIRS